MSDVAGAACEESRAWRLLLLRLGPGADVIRELTAQMRESVVVGAAIVCAVGSLSELEFSTVRFEGGRIAYSPRRRLRGAVELCSLAGHLGFQGGDPATHLHGSFALEGGEVVGGHIFSARVLATLELTLLGTEDVTWAFQAYPASAGVDAGVRYLAPRLPDGG